MEVSKWCLSFSICNEICQIAGAPAYVWGVVPGQIVLLT